MDGEMALRETVERQAAARVAGDEAAFASYLTAQALLQLGGGGRGAPVLPRARRYEILDISDRGDGTADTAVRFEGAGSYVVRTRWESDAGVWRGVEAKVPAESMRTPWWRRLIGQGPRAARTVERRDLS
ncbi:MAG TPA: hypothetical protein VEZ14_02305 [Dehalococcoidia bacterium]|nr:hypothetical protein [Dehalococcoidia bacterium]